VAFLDDATPAVNSPFYWKPKGHQYCTAAMVLHSGNSLKPKLEDHQGQGPEIAQGARNLGGQQTAFDAEVSAIEQAVRWFLTQARDY
jgi:hypothetical protein